MSDESAGAMVACVRCGTATDSRSALHSGEGLICATCENADATSELWKGAAAKLLGSSFSSIGLGLVSIIFNPCFLMTGLAIGTAVGALTSLQRHPEYRPHLGWRMPVVIVASAIGIVLALARVILAVVLGAMG
ncbi:MAG: hypothetical protein M3Y87_28135 [Myxococcota bacterium]|nr:hypothetical protein [Myxococcota bacterium]